VTTRRELSTARHGGRGRRRFLSRAVLAAVLLCLAVGTGNAVGQEPSFALRVSGTLMLVPSFGAEPGARDYDCGDRQSCHPAPIGTLIAAVNGDNPAALTVCGYGQVSDGQGHYQLDVPLSAVDACITNGAPVSRNCPSGTIGLIFVINGESAGGTCAPQRLGASGQRNLFATDLPAIMPVGSPYVTLPVVRFVGQARLVTVPRSSSLGYNQFRDGPLAPKGTMLYAYAGANEPGCSSFYPTENGPGCSGEVFCGSGQVYDNQGNFAVDAQPLSPACEGVGSPGLSYSLETDAGYYVLGYTVCVAFDPRDGESWGHLIPGGVQIAVGDDPSVDPRTPPPPPPIIPPTPWETQPVPDPGQPVPVPPSVQPQPQPNTPPEQSPPAEGGPAPQAPPDSEPCQQATGEARQAVWAQQVRCQNVPPVVHPDPTMQLFVDNCFRGFRAAGRLSPGTAAFLRTLDRLPGGRSTSAIRVSPFAGFVPAEGVTAPSNLVNAMNGVGTSATIQMATNFPLAFLYEIGLPFAPTPCAVLIHELTHARDAVNGQLDNSPVYVNSYVPEYDPTKFIPRAEIDAMTVMNRYLRTVGYGPVTQYAVRQPDGGAVYLPLPDSAIAPSR